MGQKLCNNSTNVSKLTFVNIFRKKNAFFLLKIVKKLVY